MVSTDCVNSNVKKVSEGTGVDKFVVKEPPKVGFLISETDRDKLDVEGDVSLDAAEVSSLAQLTVHGMAVTITH